MPIKDKSAYPSDWTEISLRIRERAGQRCEFCAVLNGSLIVRSEIDGSRYITYDPYLDCFHFPNGTPVRLSEIPEEYPVWNDEIKVVLTVAHLNHDTTDNSDGNLKALCQRCHLRLDAPYHAKNAAKTRAAKERARIEKSGQMALFGDVDTEPPYSDAQIGLPARFGGHSGGDV